MYALKKTGYDIQFKIKPFDNKLELPEDYDFEDDNDNNKIIDKLQYGLKEYTELYESDIKECIDDEGSHANIAKLASKILNNTIVYDDKAELWVYVI